MSKGILNLKQRGVEQKERKNKRPAVAARKANAVKGGGGPKPTMKKRKLESRTAESFLGSWGSNRSLFKFPFRCISFNDYFKLENKDVLTALAFVLNYLIIKSKAPLFFSFLKTTSIQNM